MLSTAGFKALVKLKEKHHRLTPELRLNSIGEAKDFLHAVALATLTGGSGLPSIFEAAQGVPYKPGSRGFGIWPKDQWWWGGELAKLEDILYLKILSGKGLFVAKRLWTSLDALERYVLEDLDAGRYDAYKVVTEAKRILQYLKEKGPTRTDILRKSLGYQKPQQGKQFRRIKDHLESLGVIVGRQAELETHLHVDVLSRWDQRFPNPLSPPPRVPRGHAFILALEEFLQAALEAAVMVDERVATGWFHWSLDNQQLALRRLLETGRVHRVLAEGRSFLTADRWLGQVQ